MLFFNLFLLFLSFHTFSQDGPDHCLGDAPEEEMESLNKNMSAFNQVLNQCYKNQLQGFPGDKAFCENGYFRSMTPFMPNDDVVTLGNRLKSRQKKKIKSQFLEHSEPIIFKKFAKTFILNLAMNGKFPNNFYDQYGNLKFIYVVKKLGINDPEKVKQLDSVITLINKEFIEQNTSVKKSVHNIFETQLTNGLSEIEAQRKSFKRNCSKLKKIENQLYDNLKSILKNENSYFSNRENWTDSDEFESKLSQLKDQLNNEQSTVNDEKKTKFNKLYSQYLQMKSEQNFKMNDLNDTLFKKYRLIYFLKEDFDVAQRPLTMLESVETIMAGTTVPPAPIIYAGAYDNQRSFTNLEKPDIPITLSHDERRGKMFPSQSFYKNCREDRFGLKEETRWKEEVKEKFEKAFKKWSKSIEENFDFAKNPQKDINQSFSRIIKYFPEVSEQAVYSMSSEEENTEQKMRDFAREVCRTSTQIKKRDATIKIANTVANITSLVAIPLTFIPITAPIAAPVGAMAGAVSSYTDWSKAQADRQSVLSQAMNLATHMEDDDLSETIKNYQKADEKFQRDSRHLVGVRGALLTTLFIALDAGDLKAATKIYQKINCAKGIQASKMRLTTSSDKAIDSYRQLGEKLYDAKDQYILKTAQNLPSQRNIDDISDLEGVARTIINPSLNLDELKNIIPDDDLKLLNNIAENENAHGFIQTYLSLLKRNEGEASKLLAYYRYTDGIKMNDSSEISNILLDVFNSSKEKNINEIINKVDNILARSSGASLHLRGWPNGETPQLVRTNPSPESFLNKTDIEIETQLARSTKFLNELIKDKDELYEMFKNSDFSEFLDQNCLKKHIKNLTNPQQLDLASDALHMLKSRPSSNTGPLCHTFLGAITSLCAISPDP